MVKWANAGHVNPGGTATWRNEDHSSVHGACFRVGSNANGRVLPRSCDFVGDWNTGALFGRTARVRWRSFEQWVERSETGLKSVGLWTQ